MYPYFAATRSINERQHCCIQEAIVGENPGSRIPSCFNLLVKRLNPCPSSLRVMYFSPGTLNAAARSAATTLSPTAVHVAFGRKGPNSYFPTAASTIFGLEAFSIGMRFFVSISTTGLAVTLTDFSGVLSGGSILLFFEVTAFHVLKKRRREKNPRKKTKNKKLKRKVTDNT